jgi:3-(3-hydroxy-phenyl)propionate hydroxylase
MCQGLRDVANLAWKLQAVLSGAVHGSGAQALLDSYGAERAAHVRELTSRIKHVGAVVGERDVARARARDKSLLAECGGIVRDTPRQDILPALTGGCLSQRATPARGTLFPQPWLAGAQGDAPQRMDDLVGHGWRLVCDDTLADAVQRADDLTVVCIGARGRRETQGVVAAWMQRHACHAALLRPDHHVFGIAADADELDALLVERHAWLHGAQHNNEAETSPS